MDMVSPELTGLELAICRGCPSLSAHASVAVVTWSWVLLTIIKELTVRRAQPQVQLTAATAWHPVTVSQGPVLRFCVTKELVAGSLV